MPPKKCAYASWKELKSKFVTAAKQWQTQKRRTEVAHRKAEEAHRVFVASCRLKDVRKREMNDAAQELLEAFPDKDLSKLTPFLEEESHSSCSESGSN